LAGETVSQLPLAVAAAADQFKVEALLPTEIVWAAGTAPPRVCVNESDVGETVSAPEFTVNETGTVIGLSATAPPLVVVAVIVTVPLYVPAESRPDCTATVITFAPVIVEPCSGPTSNQLGPPLDVLAETV